jgi:hypothetical protein
MPPSETPARVGWGYAAADNIKLVWGSDTRARTTQSMFAIEEYVGGFAW